MPPVRVCRPFTALAMPGLQGMVYAIPQKRRAFDAAGQLVVLQIIDISISSIYPVIWVEGLNTIYRLKVAVLLEIYQHRHLLAT